MLAASTAPGNSPDAMTAWDVINTKSPLKQVMLERASSIQIAKYRLV